MNSLLKACPNLFPVPLAVIWAVLICALPCRTRAWGQDDAGLEMLPPIGSSEADSSASAETILPSEEVVADPPQGPWIVQPSTWFNTPVWDFGAELGINGSAGNAQAFSMLAAFNGKRETEGQSLDWDLKYGKTQTGGVETQHFALFNSRWDWKYSPVWFVYTKNNIEYDEFKAFDVRLVLSGGLGHHFIKNEMTTATARLGAGTSHEIGGPDDSWVPEANIGSDLEHKISARQKIKFVADYYPSFEAFEDYRLVSNAHWEILLDEETNLSLKLGAVDRYDSTPNGAVRNDISYFVTLLWKL